MEKLLDKFLRYVAVETTSDEESATQPSAKRELDLLRMLRDELQQMGIKPEECYLYMHGHTLFENVVMTLLTPVCNILRREREREINELAIHETQKQNELSSYRHSQMPVDVMLRKSTGFKSSPQYQLLKEDIMRVTAEVGLEK